MSEKLREIMQELKVSNAETYYHSIRVKGLSFKMMKELNSDGVTNYNDEEIASICKGALLHDIGKLSVKNAILTKDTSLTEEEKSDMSYHTRAGYDLVKNELGKGEYEIVKNICLYHHDRIGGLNENLPFYVQLVSLCDVFDALRTDRVYRDALSYNVAMDLIKMGECGKFDEQLIEYLEKITAEEEE